MIASNMNALLTPAAAVPQPQSTAQATATQAPPAPPSPVQKATAETTVRGREDQGARPQASQPGEPVRAGDPSGVRGRTLDISV